MKMIENIEENGDPKFLEAPDIDFSELAKINSEIQKNGGIPLFGTIFVKDGD